MDQSQPFLDAVDSPTWLLYVALLLVTLFFRFSRVVSVRNLDLGLLLSLSTALVLWASAANALASPEDLTPDETAIKESMAQWASIVVIVLSILFILRLTFDEALTRRPRLEQNLNQAGLSFLCLLSFSILMVGVFLKTPPNNNVDTVEAADALLLRQESSANVGEDEVPPAPTGTLVAAAVTKMSELSGRVEPDEEF